MAFPESGEFHVAADGSLSNQHDEIRQPNQQNVYTWERYFKLAVSNGMPDSGYGHGVRSKTYYDNWMHQSGARVFVNGDAMCHIQSTIDDDPDNHWIEFRRPQPGPATYVAF